MEADGAWLERIAVGDRAFCREVLDCAGPQWRFGSVSPRPKAAEGRRSPRRSAWLEAQASAPHAPEHFDGGNRAGLLR